MNIQTELYNESLNRKPGTGKHIIGHQKEGSIVLYQAYKPSIAEAAVQNQCLGGGGFSYDRMSWVKPGFLWMMYRCGWASKTDQERVLALWIQVGDFKAILKEAIPSTFKHNQFADKEEWQKELKRKNVRLQWDPDHLPLGGKEERRAIQLGLKGKVLNAFGNQYIKKVEDITGFVKEQSLLLNNRKLDELKVPVETILEIEDKEIRTIIGLT